ncbi:MAG: glycosyltransferase [Muribaculaceae bacterium]|nr:glycosyltransferase [Muribaculaceae bacterium]
MAFSKISVIIPVYKAEKYMEKACRSLFSQTFGDVEYIFIDDASPDRSIELMRQVLGDFPHRKNQVRVISHPSNAGVGRSRQDGVDRAEGKFIIHFDPDDWAEPNWLEALYDAAVDKNADIVYCDFYEETASEAQRIEQPYERDKKALFHEIAFENLHGALWNKLIASSLAKSVRIQPGVNLWEDLSIVPYMMMAARKIVKVNRALYHYNLTNLDSLSQWNGSANAMSCILALDSLLDIMKRDGLLRLVDARDLFRLQWSAKKGLILDPSEENLNIWNEKYHESNNHISGMGLPLRFKIISYLAKHKNLTLLKFYQSLKNK